MKKNLLIAVLCGISAASMIYGYEQHKVSVNLSALLKEKEDALAQEQKKAQDMATIAQRQLQLAQINRGLAEKEAAKAAQQDTRKKVPKK